MEKNVNFAIREEKEIAPKRIDFEKLVKDWQSLRPQIDEFEDLQDTNGKSVYTKQELREDNKMVLGKIGGLATESRFNKIVYEQLSEDFEYCLMEAFHERNWLDGDVSVCPGSNYDDLFNGVDFVLSFRKENEKGEDDYLYLAVDATISPDRKILEKKEMKIKNNIEEGRLNEVKYFINDDKIEDKGRKRMPSIILQMLPHQAENFKDLILKGHKLNERDQEIMDELRKEIFQNIKMQLKLYLDLTKIFLRYEDKYKADNFKDIINKYSEIIDYLNKKGE